MVRAIRLRRLHGHCMARGCIHLDERCTTVSTATELALFYSFTTLLVGLAGAILPWAEWFNKRENKNWRIAVFLTMCFTAVAPFSHAAFEHGLAKDRFVLQSHLPLAGFLRRWPRFLRYAVSRELGTRAFSIHGATPTSSGI